jgi:xanthine dehydrogenase accessory factor
MQFSRWERESLRPASGERGRANWTMQTFNRLIEALKAEGAGALVSIIKVDGSSPRESGTRMVVRPSGAFNGTIGGGQLEWRALAAAQEALRKGRAAPVRRTVLLGPDLAQCCGGRVEWLIETFDQRDAAELEALAAAEREGPLVIQAVKTEEGRLSRKIATTPADKGPPIETRSDGTLIERFGDSWTDLYLFGAGHVGRALVLALAPLPFRVRWIDSRQEAFPLRAPTNVTMVQSDDPAAELDTAPAGAFALVMTHSHPLDLAIVARALAAERFGFVGLIGSATKRARFLSQMRAAGMTPAMLSRLTCPIGLPGIEGKEPAVIAAAVAAQLLLERG